MQQYITELTRSVNDNERFQFQGGCDDCVVTAMDPTRLWPGAPGRFKQPRAVSARPWRPTPPGIVRLQIRPVWMASRHRLILPATMPAPTRIDGSPRGS